MTSSSTAADHRVPIPGSVIGKVALVLAVLAEGGAATLTEISRNACLPLSTAHRIVTEMTAQRLLVREEGRYRPGRMLRTFAEPGYAPDVAEMALTTLTDLATATGNATRLAVLDGPGVLVVARAMPRRPAERCRLLVPSHATAAGKVLLAFSPPTSVEHLAAGGLASYTRATVTSPELLRRTLAHVRRTRIATACEEHRAGENAVAAPVFGSGGHIAAAIETVVPKLADDLPAVRAALSMAASGLSQAVTHRHPTLRNPREFVYTTIIGAG